MDEQEKIEQMEKLRQIRKEGAKGCLTLIISFFIFVLILIAATGGCRDITDQIMGRKVELNAYAERKDFVVYITNFDTDSWKDVKVTLNSRYYTFFDEIKPNERVSVLCWTKDLEGNIRLFKPDHIEIEAKYKDKKGHYFKILSPR